MNHQVKEKIFTKIISGGQTGVDRAALDAAGELGLEAGGWCPRGRRAEDGRIDDRYPLKETASWKYPVRTRKNVEESDGTLILTRGAPKGGTALTVRMAEKSRKPFQLVDLTGHPVPQDELWFWGRRYGIKTLNIAGPRESEAPGIYREAVQFIGQLLRDRSRRLQ